MALFPKDYYDHSYPYFFLTSGDSGNGDQSLPHPSLHLPNPTPLSQPPRSLLMPGVCLISRLRGHAPFYKQADSAANQSGRVKRRPHPRLERGDKSSSSTKLSCWSPLAIGFFIHKVGIFDQRSFWPSYLLPAVQFPHILIGGQTHGGRAGKNGTEIEDTCLAIVWTGHTQ